MIDLAANDVLSEDRVVKNQVDYFQSMDNKIGVIYSTAYNDDWKKCIRKTEKDMTKH